MKLKWIITGIVALLVAVVVAGFIAISTIDVEEYRGVIEAEAEKATGRKLTLAGPMDLKVSFTPAIAIEDVSFANAEWGSRPEMAKIDRFEVEVALIPLLSGDIQVNRLVIVQPDILLETDKQGRGNWELPAMKGDKAEAAPESGGEASLPSIGLVRIVDGTLTYKNGQTGETIKLGLEKVSTNLAGSGNIDLEIAGSYQDVPFDLEGSIGQIATLTSGSPYPVDLAGKVAGADLSVSGTVASVTSAPSPNLDISVKGESLDGFNALAGGGLPPLGPYSLSGKLTGGGNRYKLAAMTLSLGGSTLNGDLQVAVGGKRPKITASLSSQSIDMADFQTGGGEATESGGKESPYVFTEDPLPVDGLSAIDADVSLEVASLKLDEKMTVESIVLPVKMNGGVLNVGPAKAGISGGTVQAKIDLNATQRTPSLNVSLDAADIDYGALLKKQGISKDVEGTIGGQISLAGAGTSARQIASGLNGKVTIVGEDGVITNKLLAIISAGLSEVMGPLMGSDKQSALNCVVARFDVKNGVADSQALLLDTETFTVGGDGKIDLRTEELDLYFDTKSRRASIASLAVPFKVGGTLKNPRVAPDPVGTAIGAAKAAGVIANPLAGVALLTGESAASTEENPCLAAIEGRQATSGSSGETTSGSSATDSVTEGAGGAAESVTKGAEDAVKGVTEGIKGLFGGSD